MFEIPEALIWIVVLAFIISFVLAFGIGANDVANSFGTSVGSKVLTLRQACILATICETAGAVLLGAKVSETIRKGIIEVDIYSEMNINGTDSGNKLLMIGQLSSLSGACIWLLVATFFRVPVSGTHSIVGATVGFALVANGTDGVDWWKLGLIVSSWFISPLFSGAISVGLFYLIKTFVLTKEDPLEPGLRLLPLIYSVTIVINVFSIVYEGPDLLRFNEVPLWGAISIAFLVGSVSSVCIKLLLIPWQRKRITRDVQASGEKLIVSENGDACQTVGDKIAKIEEEDETIDSNGQLNASGGGGGGGGGLKAKLLQGFSNKKADTDCQPATACNNGKSDVVEANDKANSPEVRDQPEQQRIFAWLQVLTALFGSFAHGGNDVSNAIGPLVGLWIVATTGSIDSKTMTPIPILLFGGAGISVGLWAWGRRVIQTLGEDLTTITPSSGFCIELGAAIAVLFASNIGIPISTTHCKVGSVVLVGFFRSRDNVQWSIFRNILLAWLVTLPISGAISGACMAIMRALVF